VPLVKWQCKFEESIELSGSIWPLLPMRGVKSGILPESACPLCRSRWKFGATDVPKAHPCGSGSGGTSTSLGSPSGPACFGHKPMPGRHGWVPRGGTHPWHQTPSQHFHVPLRLTGHCVPPESNLSLHPRFAGPEIASPRVSRDWQ
jgi:hypothetical protein